MSTLYSISKDLSNCSRSLEKHAKDFPIYMWTPKVCISASRTKVISTRCCRDTLRTTSKLPSSQTVPESSDSEIWASTAWAFQLESCHYMLHVPEFTLVALYPYLRPFIRKTNDRLLSITERITRNSWMTLSTSVFDKSGFQMLRQRSLLKNLWRPSRDVGRECSFNSKISILNSRSSFLISGENDILASTTMYDSPFKIDRANEDPRNRLGRSQRIRQRDSSFRNKTPWTSSCVLWCRQCRCRRRNNVERLFGSLRPYGGRSDQDILSRRQ